MRNFRLCESNLTPFGTQKYCCAPKITVAPSGCDIKAATAQQHNGKNRHESSTYCEQ
jgi:hypothetical protein